MICFKSIPSTTNHWVAWVYENNLKAHSVASSVPLTVNKISLFLVKKNNGMQQSMPLSQPRPGWPGPIEPGPAKQLQGPQQAQISLPGFTKRVKLDLAGPSWRTLQVHMVLVEDRTALSGFGRLHLKPWDHNNRANRTQWRIEMVLSWSTFFPSSIFLLSLVVIRIAIEVSSPC